MAELAQETREKLRAPQMLTGTVEGRFLEMLVFASGAERVLELGTYSGYSALSMAAALPPDGRVVTCEVDEEHADFAQRHIDASPYAERIEIRVGPALDTIAASTGRSTSCSSTRTRRITSTTTRPSCPSWRSGA